jgi:hypothetical protein
LVPQLLSVVEVHVLVHHGMLVMHDAGELQSELVVHGSPVGIDVTPPSPPGIGAQ